MLPVILRIERIYIENWKLIAWCSYYNIFADFVMFSFWRFGPLIFIWILQTTKVEILSIVFDNEDENYDKDCPSHFPKELKTFCKHLLDFIEYGSEYDQTNFDPDHCTKQYVVAKIY